MDILGVSIWQIIIVVPLIISAFTIVFLPAIVIICSKKSYGSSKLAWVLVAFTFSWIGYIAYYFMVARKATDNKLKGYPND